MSQLSKLVVRKAKRIQKLSKERKIKFVPEPTREPLPAFSMPQDLLRKLSKIRDLALEFGVTNVSDLEPMRQHLFDAGKLAMSLVPDHSLSSEFYDAIASALPSVRNGLKDYMEKLLIQETIFWREVELEALYISFEMRVKSIMKPLLLIQQICEPAKAKAEVCTIGNTFRRSGLFLIQPKEEASASNQLSKDSTEGPKQPKFKWTKDLKELVYKIVSIEVELAEIKGPLNDAKAKLPEGTIRKTVYKKVGLFFGIELYICLFLFQLLPFWPKNWMTTHEISKVFSVVKCNFEKGKARDGPEVKEGKSDTAKALDKIGEDVS